MISNNPMNVSCFGEDHLAKISTRLERWFHTKYAVAALFARSSWRSRSRREVSGPAVFIRACSFADLRVIRPVGAPCRCSTRGALHDLFVCSQEEHACESSYISRNCWNCFLGNEHLKTLSTPRLHLHIHLVHNSPGQLIAFSSTVPSSYRHFA